MTNARYPEPESSTLEFKRSLPKSDQITKTMIAFCNHHGGKLVVGVADDRTIIGLSDQEIDECLEWVEKAVYDASFPAIIPRVSTLRIEDKNVLILEVSSGMNKPYYRRTEGIDKGTYIRVGRNTVRATPEMIEELRWQSAGIHFETLPIYRATEADIDDTLIRNFLRKRKNDGETDPDLKTLKAYGLVASEHSHDYPTTAGILLFGKSPQKFFTESMIICTQFEGTEGREVIATIDCEGDLLTQFKMAYDFVISRMTKSFSIKEPKRVEKLEVPKKAIREALLNAIIHRNYHIQASIKVAVWSDRIEIFSPGAFSGPIDVNNLRAGRSYIRNPHICKVFREAGYIEKLGSGFITILDSYKDYHLPPPQVVDGGDYVKCILSRPSPNQQEPYQEDLSSQVLALFRVEPEMQTKDILNALGVPRATLHRVLSELIEDGVLARVGQTHATRYKLLKK